ncbi:unnamed protein product [Lepidochelys olivacea]
MPSSTRLPLRWKAELSLTLCERRKRQQQVTATLKIDQLGPAMGLEQNRRPHSPSLVLRLLSREGVTDTKREGVGEEMMPSPPPRRDFAVSYGNGMYLFRGETTALQPGRGRCTRLQASSH